MKILILGGYGMLGHKLVQTFGNKFEIYTTIRGKYKDVEKYGFFDAGKTFEKIDAEKITAVEEIIGQIKPFVVINCVGIIKQISASKNVIKTLTINSIFPHQLAELSRKHRFRLINISTDCVFSGNKGDYAEDDVCDAVDLYGKSKNLGEITEGNCITLRTSIIGRELQTAHSLVEWFLSHRNNRVKGYTNAVYTGFPTSVFADIISELITKHPRLSGLYHVSSNPINKYELLKLLNKYYDANVSIEPFEDFKIDRSLSSEKYRSATGFAAPGWDSMIEKMATDPTPYDEWRK